MVLPDTVTKLRSLLGLVNFFMDFIDHFAEKSHQLYALLKGKMKKKGDNLDVNSRSSFSGTQRSCRECSYATYSITEWQNHSVYRCLRLCTGRASHSGDGWEGKFSFICKQSFFGCPKKMGSMHSTTVLKKLHYRIGGIFCALGP